MKLYGEVPHPERAATARRKSMASKIVLLHRAARTKHISTSHVERQNLTMRMSMRRFTRLTNGFSKKIREPRPFGFDPHFHALQFRAHPSKALRITPAMAAGVTSKLWSLGRHGSGCWKIGEADRIAATRGHVNGERTVG